jgi:hypothetical protein
MLASVLILIEPSPRDAISAGEKLGQRQSESGTSR